MFVFPIVTEFAHELVFTALLSILGAAFMWPFRKAKAAYTEFHKSLKDVQEELVTQRSNCLHTLQEQGVQQIATLKEISGTLTSIHLDQKETLGRLSQR